MEKEIQMNPLRRMETMEADKELRNAEITFWSVYRALKRHYRARSYKNLFWYMLFLFIFIYITMNERDINRSFQQNDAILNLLIDEEFETELETSISYDDDKIDEIDIELEGPLFKKNFGEIEEFEEFWEWVEGPLFEAVYDDDFENEDFEDPKQHNLIMSNLILGGVRFRQMRVKSVECEQAISQMICYPPWSFSSEETEPFGSNNQWTYTKDTGSELLGKNGFENGIGFRTNYGRGGHLILLPLNETAALEIIKTMKEDEWLDRATRAIAVDINLFNVNTKTGTSIRLVIEFFATGYVGKEVIAIPIVPDPYSHKTFWQILFQILFCFSLLYFIVVEIQEFLLLRVKYFTIGIWNWADMLNIFLFIFSIVRWVQYTTNDYVKNFEEIILSKFEDEFFDLYEIAILFRNISDYASLCVFVSVLRIFKYLQVNKSFTILWSTLSRASKDLWYLTVVFTLIMCTFAFSGYLIFGSTVEDFHSFFSSLSTLCQVLLGEFDYKALSDSRPLIAPIYMAVFILIAFMVLFNMFIAVITEHYETEKDISNVEKKLEEGSFALVMSTKQRFLHSFGFFVLATKRDDRGKRDWNGVWWYNYIVVPIKRCFKSVVSREIPENCFSRCIKAFDDFLTKVARRVLLLGAKEFGTKPGDVDGGAVEKIWKRYDIQLRKAASDFFVDFKQGGENEFIENYLEIVRIEHEIDQILSEVSIQFHQKNKIEFLFVLESIVSDSTNADRAVEEKKNKELESYGKVGRKIIASVFSRADRLNELLDKVKDLSSIIENIKNLLSKDTGPDKKADDNRT